MKIRLLAAVICTAFSFFAIGMSFTVQSPVLIAPWVAYLAILYFWVTTNRAPKLLLMTGTVLGTIAMVTSMFMGLVWAFPAVLLMLHVIKCTYFPPMPISQR